VHRRHGWYLDYIMESNHVNDESAASLSVEVSTPDSEEESEGEPTSPSSFECGSDPNGPRKLDVLMGRGKPFQNYFGNRRMLRIVSQFKSEYASRPRDQKRLYVETALEAVLKDGARFLRRVEVGDGSHRWEEVDRAAAAEKVWNVLRSKGESRRRKTVRFADQADEHAQCEHPHALRRSFVEEMGENFTGSRFAYQQHSQIDTGGISRQHISLVESLSNVLLYHLSNATVTALLLVALTTSQAKIVQATLPAATNTGACPLEDLSIQNALQVLLGELLRSHFQGTATSPSLVLYQPQAPLIVANPTIAGNPDVASHAVAPVIPLVIQPNMLVNQPDDPQQGQLIQEVISSRLRQTAQIHHLSEDI